MDLNTQALLNGVSITANYLGYVSGFRSLNVSLILELSHYLSNDRLNRTIHLPGSYSFKQFPLLNPNAFFKWGELPANNCYSRIWWGDRLWVRKNDHCIYCRDILEWRTCFNILSEHCRCSLICTFRQRLLLTVPRRWCSRRWKFNCSNNYKFNWISWILKSYTWIFLNFS